MPSHASSDAQRPLRRHEYDGVQREYNVVNRRGYLEIQVMVRDRGDEGYSSSSTLKGVMNDPA